MLILDLTARERADQDGPAPPSVLQATLDALPAHIALLDEAGQIIAINAAWRHFAEANGLRRPDHGVGANYLAEAEGDLDDESGRVMADGIRRVLAGERPAFSMSYPCHAPDEQRWFMARATRLAGIWPPMVLVAHEDVTGRTLAELDVRRHEEQLRGALEATAMGTFVWHVAADRVECDTRMLSLFGLGPDDTLSLATALAALIHPDDRDRYAAAVERAIDPAGSSALREDIRVVLPDGTPRWLAISGQVTFADSASRSPQMAGTAVDITERKDVEAAVAQRQREFETLAEHLPDVVARFDRELRHLYVNAAATAASGLGRDAYLGRTNAELGLPPPLVRLWAEHSQAAFTTGDAQDLAFSYDGPAGTRHYEARIVPERGPDGDIETVLAVTTDISTRQRSEQERTTFLDSVAHDVRNPLGVIKAQAQLAQRRMRRGVTDPAPLEAGLTAIEAGVDEATGLIDELLDVAHLRAGRSLELRVSPTDLVALAEVAAAAARRTATSHVVRVETEIPILIGMGDAARLQRVLANLLGNALKYSPEGGEVVLQVGQDVDDHGSWAVIAVSDQGIGIPAADLPHLFERFRRGGNVGGIGGTGLGLAGARQIIAQHGGTIRVASIEGQGSRFTLRLPLRTAPSLTAS